MIILHAVFHTSTAEFFEKSASRTPKKAFIVFEGKEYSYESANVTANLIATWAARTGVSSIIFKQCVVDT